MEFFAIQYEKKNTKNKTNKDIKKVVVPKADTPVEQSSCDYPL